MRCTCDPSPDGTGGDTVVDHIRLFPLRDDVLWTYRVHEQILPALNRAKVPVRWAERGDHAEARRLWVGALAECPGDREALAKLERLSMTQGTCRSARWER